MKIVFPWPSPKVFPNYKRANHWRKFRAVEKSEREAGCILTCAAIPANERRELRDRLTGKLALSITFYPPDRRHRDDDGMVGAFKHYRDGMADSLGIDDRHFRCTYAFGEPEKPGRVEVVL
jgi:crossover junction endodeoxyribonuclease RusA